MIVTFCQRLVRQPSNPIWSRRNVERNIRVLTCSLSKQKGGVENDAKQEDRPMSKKQKVIQAKMERNKKAENIAKYLNKSKKIKEYVIHEKMSINELCKVTNVPKDIVLDVLLSHRKFEANSYDEPIGTRELFDFLAKKMNCKFKFATIESSKSSEEIIEIVHPSPKLEDLVPRPPVVAIIGHIDHGKTTLLDRLRKSNVVETEFGGITQHIGAFSVNLKTSNVSMDKVTFLDTPGHAAFKNMRIRGALVTDIVILVVDACEGPLEQTFESIEAVKKARVSLVVALNKVDKPEADVEKTKKALYDAGVALEDYGGDVQAVPISALHGNGVDDLIEALLAQAEILQLSADPKGPVEGSIIESFQELGLGKTATVLLKRGTLTKGKVIVCGETFAKVKQLLDTRAPISDQLEERAMLKSIGPSEACRVTGWKALPHAGDIILEADNEKEAGRVVKSRANQRQVKEQQESFQIIEEKRQLERQIYEGAREDKLRQGINMYKPIFGTPNSEAREHLLQHYKSSPNDKRLSIIVKADVDGSLEALNNCLATYDEEEVTLDVITTGVGEITENDLKMAQDFEGIVYAFNVAVSDQIRKAASSIYNVTVRDFNVIYALIDDLKEEVNQKLPVVDEEYVLGKAMVAQQFTISEKKAVLPVAGCRVTAGVIDITKSFKVVRGKNIIHEGPLDSLKHFKEEVTQLKNGSECGIRFQDASVSFQPGDVIVCYELRPEKRETSWSPGF